MEANIGAWGYTFLLVYFKKVEKYIPLHRGYTLEKHMYTSYLKNRCDFYQVSITASFKNGDWVKKFCILLSYQTNMQNKRLERLNYKVD